MVNLSFPVTDLGFICDCVVNFEYFSTRPFGQASFWYDTSESGVFCPAGKNWNFWTALKCLVL